MKKILIILFIFPLISVEARTPAPSVAPSGRNVRIDPKVVLPSTGNAFRGAVPINVEGCSGVCADNARVVLGPKSIRTLNRYQLQGDSAVPVAKVIKLAPTVNTKLNNKGMNPSEAKETTTALVAAAAQSREWNDPQAQENMLAYVQQLAVDGPRRHDKEKLEEIRKNCQL